MSPSNYHIDHFLLRWCTFDQNNHSFTWQIMVGSTSPHHSKMKQDILLWSLLLTDYVKVVFSFVLLCDFVILGTQAPEGKSNILKESEYRTKGKNGEAFKCIKLACVLSRFSHVCLFTTLWMVASRAPLSMGVSRQEYRGGVPFPPPGESPWPRDWTCISDNSCIAGRFFTAQPPGNPCVKHTHHFFISFIMDHPFLYLPSHMDDTLKLDRRLGKSPARVDRRRETNDVTRSL